MGNFYMFLLVVGCRVTGFGNGTLRLTPFPATATEGNLYTLVCTSSSVTVSRSTWYLETAAVLETHYSNTSTRCDTVVVNYGVFDTYLPGRVDATTCGVFQHNVTLRINSTIDNGTVWWCKDKTTDETSNTVTIDVINEPVASTTFLPTTATPTTTRPTTTPPTTTTPRTALTTTTDAATASSTVSDTYTGNQLSVIYIAVGVCAAVVVVIAIVIVVIFVVLLRRRKAQGKKLEFDEPKDKSTSAPSTISRPVMFSCKTCSTPDPTRYREFNISHEPG